VEAGVQKIRAIIPLQIHRYRTDTEREKGILSIKANIK
jgi:hypothetical protein